MCLFNWYEGKKGFSKIQAMKEVTKGKNDVIKLKVMYIII